MGELEALEDIQMKKSRFVVIEGTDGSGKTTQIGLLEKYLIKQKLYKYKHIAAIEKYINKY